LEKTKPSYLCNLTSRDETESSSV